MKPSIKQSRHDKRLADLLGMNPEEVQALRVKEDADAHVREAQALLLFIEKPDAFISKKCDECKQMFATTYQFVSVCSTACRIRSLEKIGIDWNPLHTPEERWKRSKIPTEYSIPPKALEVLLRMAEEQKPRESYVVPGTDVLAEILTIYEPDESLQNNDQSYNDPPESEPSKPPVSKDPLLEDLFAESGLAEFL